MSKNKVSGVHDHLAFSYRTSCLGSLLTLMSGLIANGVVQDACFESEQVRVVGESTNAKSLQGGTKVMG
jgi:hypothetical protein